jgi:selenocysteine-specific elongation factor
MNAARQIVVGTAGHIDHGKSQLVRALTGIDPDRLKEEKERGITIDLGFANLALEDGTRIGFVDVPGHERFVKNMLAGVGGIDLVLLVIAADESIKPQTREHFDICRLLRIPGGIIVLTKIDIVEPDLLDLARLEAREFVAGSFLESAPIVALSSRTGAGLDELRSALERAAAAVPARPGSGPIRMPIDRSFSIKGFGTVVTGTLVAGTIREADEVTILPRGVTARVRGLEVFNRPTPIALPGQRTAVNLQGIEAGSIERGEVLTTPGVLAPSYLLDVSLEVLKGAAAPLKDLARVRFHHGTLEAMARVRLVGAPALAPGGQAFAQLRLERPVTALPGDRFIVRRYSPSVTLGGGAVLHNRPPKLRRSAPGTLERFRRLADPSPAAGLRVLIDEAGEAGIDDAGLRSRTGLDPEAAARHLESAVASGEVVVLPPSPRRYLSRMIHRELADGLVRALEAFHQREPLQEGMPREEIRTRLFARSHADVFRAVLADLSARGVLRTGKDRVALARHQVTLSTHESSLLEQIEARFAAAGVNPPELTAVIADLKADPRQAEKLFHLLLSRGRLVRIPDGKVFHTRSIEDLKRRLWEKRAESPVIEISEFKDLSGTSRKNAIPLLEHFDQTRVTRREGNRRVILPPPGTAATSN